MSAILSVNFKVSQSHFSQGKAMKKLFWLKILLAYLLSASGTEVDSIHKFLVDVVQLEQFPSILLAKVCWTQRDKIDFMRKFPHSSSFIEKSKEMPKLVGNDRNKIWFFVDMKCSTAAAFLQSVDEYYLGHPFRWIFMNGENEEIARHNFLPGSNVIAISHDESNFKQFQLNQSE